jgi:Domain of unknown function (DUF4214)
MSSHPPITHSTLQCEQLETRLALTATSYVTSLYQNLLNRAPDSAGLTFWVNQINSGLSNFQVAQDFWRSAEHRALEIESYYTTYLGRTADRIGLNFWVNQMLRGEPEVDVVAQFLTSGEYIFLHPTPANYITALYAAILSRLPSGTELNFWENELAVNGAGRVTAGILLSRESAIDIISFDYVAYLERQPDVGGLNNWLNQLMSNTASVETVAEGIIGSTEYAALH